MVDKLSPEARSENMRRIKSKDTAPELVVRRAVHTAGLRYRLHKKGLPGRPDLVFASRMTCVFVHGCFWHGCPKCIDGTRKVKSNSEFWRKKVEGNKARDVKHKTNLKILGWKVLEIWECETRNKANLEALVEQVRSIPIPQPRTRKGQTQAADTAHQGGAV